jgi:ABC-type multidrug transport system fused ATPase/permease subunit
LKLQFSLIEKVFSILPTAKKREFYILGVLQLIGMALEVLGIGLLIPIFSIMSSSSTFAAPPPILKSIIQILGSPSPNTFLVYYMIFVAFFYFMKSLFFANLIWLQNKIANDLHRHVSTKLLFGYLNQPYHFHLKVNSSKLISTIQTEVAQLSNVFLAFLFILVEIGVIFSIICFLIWKDPLVTVMVFFFFLVSSWTYQRVSRRSLLFWGLKRQDLSFKIHQNLQESFVGIKDIMLYGKKKWFFKIFNQQIDEYTDTTAKINTANAFPRFFLEMLVIVMLTFLVSFMVWMNKSNSEILSILMLFSAAAFRTIPSFSKILSSLQTIRYSSPVVDSIYNEFYNSPPNVEFELEDSNSTELNFTFNSSIKITDLNFTHVDSDNETLKDINLSISKGQSIGIIGESGSGKTTLVDLLLGLHLPTKGVIEVDSVNISDIMENWRGLIGYVPQFIFLIDDSIRRNIAFGIPETQIDDSRIAQIIKEVNLVKLIESLPQGYDTIVGEQGVRLSGGQRQRLGIARALYRNPEILIFDEATSALDIDTEKNIMEEIQKYKNVKTLIFITHRLSSLVNCNQVYRIESGKILFYD